MTARFDASTIDQRIVMYGKTWADFEAQVALRGEDARRPKLAFLDGAVELMSPAYDHEDTSRALAIILGFYCAEVGIAARATGAWLLKRAPDAGVEPDESFVFGSERTRPEHPDLVIEVVWTHGDIDKMEIYRRLAIPEVWWWENDEIAVHVLRAGKYHRSARSSFFPDLDLVRLVALAKELPPFDKLPERIRRDLVAK